LKRSGEIKTSNPSKHRKNSLRQSEAGFDILNYLLKQTNKEEKSLEEKLQIQWN
jgi:hypothetical protein